MSLNRRTPEPHPQKQVINQRATNLHSGYKGEKALEYYLNFLPEDQFFIFHYLRLPDKYGHFQLDFLLLTIYFHLIIEVKNIYGNINFDKFGQAFREIDDEVKVFSSPVQQVNLQHSRLMDWHRINDLPTVPIEKIVVYSRDDMYLRNLSNDKIISDLVMHRDKLLPKIKSYMEKYQTPRLTEKQIMEMSCKLMEEHCPEDFLLMEKLGMSSDQLIKGVFCPGCENVPMLWGYGKWHCSHCGFLSKTAHQPALADFVLLNQDFITNKQAREVLQLNSIHTTKRLLQREAIAQHGISSGTNYKLDFEKLLS